MTKVPILVLLESPWAGNTVKHARYLRACMRDSLMRGEAPFASHGLYTQPGVLDDLNPTERKLGMDAGFAWGELATKVVVYVDLGISPGMQRGIDRATMAGQEIETRLLGGVWAPAVVVP